MNRRDFLAVLAGTATAAGLLVPSTRKIFLPPPGGWPSPRYRLQVSIEFDKLDGTESTFSNRLNPASGVTQADIDKMLEEISKGSRTPLRYLLGSDPDEPECFGNSQAWRV